MNEDDQIMLEDTLDMALECSEWFDSTFLDSLQEFFEERGFLTEKQRTALQNISTMLEGKINEI